MELPKKEIVDVINLLLPGFLAAWVFYGLTPHPKKSPFERIVEALIFTGIVQATVTIYGSLAIWIGTAMPFGEWNEPNVFVVSILIAFLVGLVFALFANTDWFHRFLRDFKWFRSFNGFTRRTSFPSEWFGAFSQNTGYIVLHLGDQRRLFGFPAEWPDAPDMGHFVIAEAAWILDDNSKVPLHTVSRIMISAKDVKFVEFVKFEVEVTAAPEELNAAVEKLTSIQNKETADDRRKE